MVRDGADINPERLSVEVAKYQLDATSSDTREIKVFHIVSHENYIPQYLENDIALLKLERLIEFTKFVQPICLTEELGTFGEETVGIVPGWGKDEHHQLSNDLLKAPLLITNHFECRQSNRDFFPNYLNENNFCAGYRNGTNVCQGDSGGGLTMKGKQKWFLRGLVSLGKALSGHENRCDITEFIILTDVVKFYSWIVNKL